MTVQLKRFGHFSVFQLAVLALLPFDLVQSPISTVSSSLQAAVFLEKGFKNLL